MHVGRTSRRKVSLWEPDGGRPGVDGVRTQRGWSNLAWGLAWLLAGALAVALIEWAWDEAHADEGNASGAGVASGGTDGGFDGEDMVAFIMEGDEKGAWQEGGPPRFAEECLDVGDLGEVRSSLDGGVVGVVSDCPADRLFGVCCERLEQRGWRKEGSGQSLRSAFLKEGGDIRWIFLDVVRVADGSVAVFVLEDFDG